MNDDHSADTGIAPADSRHHAPWPTWKKIAAYAVLGALAAASIRHIDREAYRRYQTDAADVEWARRFYPAPFSHFIYPF